MKILIIIFLTTITIFTFQQILRIKPWRKKKLNLLERYKSKISKNRLKIQRFSDELSNSLMSSPEKNIKVASWEQEYILREKADIHRARLQKYGKSKMNGEMLFLGPKGGVYKYTNKGKRKYL